MPAILIKDFPRDLHREMKLQAVRLEMSLKGLIIRYCQEGLEGEKKGQRKKRV